MDGVNVKYFSPRKLEWDTDNLRMQSIMNNYGLGLSDRQALYRSLRTEGAEKTSIMFQLAKFVVGQGTPSKPRETPKSTASGSYNPLVDADAPASAAITEVFLQRALDEAELNETGLSSYPLHHYDKHFAAGMVASSSFLPVLLCQAYFRPFLIDVIKGLLANVAVVGVNERVAGRRYGEVVGRCVREGCIPIGIYREGAGGGAMAYVYTNPRPEDIVTSRDVLFVIKIE